LSEMSLGAIGFALVILGVILAFAAVILLAVRSHASGTKTRGAGVLLIGPIPIIFGTDSDSAKILVALAILLMVIVLVFMFLPSLLLNR
jgi:uncharacterized protein (TIGR00304 family)